MTTIPSPETIIKLLDRIDEVPADHLESDVLDFKRWIDAKKPLNEAVQMSNSMVLSITASVGSCFSWAVAIPLKALCLDCLQIWNFLESYGSSPKTRRYRFR